MTNLARLLAAVPERSKLISVRGDLLIAELSHLGLRDGFSAPAHVAILVDDPATMVRLLAALDGEVETIVLLQSDLGGDGVRNALAKWRCEVLVTDTSGILPSNIEKVSAVEIFGNNRRAIPIQTQWVLATSGTTRSPKTISHSLASLIRTIRRENKPAALASPAVWGLTYDLRRFAGLQVLLQGILTGSSIVVVDHSAPYSAQLSQLIENGCTHLSATPTYWRQLLMCPDHRKLALQQATLGGEIADQYVLSAIRLAYPHARLSHIYASTEVGVGFSVVDGKAGFPKAFLTDPPKGTELKIRDEVLWLKPPGSANIERAEKNDLEIDDEGFIRSGDIVRVEKDRVHFLGRESGVINVGGVKTLPEVVEAVMRSVAGVNLVRVSGKANPLTGAIVVAEVVLAAGSDATTVRQLLKDRCAAQLRREAVPAIIRFVDELKLGSTGKLARL